MTKTVSKILSKIPFILVFGKLSREHFATNRALAEVVSSLTYYKSHIV